MSGSSPPAPAATDLPGDTDPADHTVRSGSRAAGGRGRAARLPSWWPLVVPVVVVVVGAWVYRWVDEDAFINFRIIDNLLAGHGLVFNVGERVEVDSDPLWLFTLTVFHEVVPFLSLEWLSVVLGLVCTAGGFVAGGRAVQRLGHSRSESPVLPVGLLMVAVVAGVWEFATSGLEMSMVFLWLGTSALVLVRVERRRSRAVPAAVLLGLGTLIRPELALVSVVWVAALLVVVAAPGWGGPAGWWRRYGAPVAAALALPLLYELFRMAYYGLLVPNTALAKAAGSPWPAQGLTYLWNFVAPYTLWLPLLLAVPLLGGRVARWGRAGDRVGVVVLLAPVVAGLADLAYVVGVGGDYMHARLLLPAFFAGCLPVFATPAQLRTWLVIPVAGIAAWAVVCCGWLRFEPPPPTSLNPQVVYLSNERNTWITATGNPHPITAADYAHAISGKGGAVLRRLADSVPPGHQRMLVITNPYVAVDPSAAVGARSPLPFTLVVNVPAIGVVGYLAGPDVYLFDSFSLANPVGSHTQVVVHARPGHEKLVPTSWMVARFGAPDLPAGTGGSPAEVAAARRALGCQPLAGYLRSITSPLTPGRAWSNLVHSFGWTTMSFSADPTTAARQLCGPGTAAAPRRPAGS